MKSQTGHWLFYSHHLLPTLDDMVQHFDNYTDLLEGVRRDGRLTTYDMTLDRSEDSLQAFSKRGRAHWYGWRQAAEEYEPPEHDRYQWDGTRWVKNGEVHLLPVVKAKPPVVKPQVVKRKPKPKPEPLPVWKPKPPPPPEPHVYDTDDVAWVEAITEKLVVKFGWHEAPARLRAHREVSRYWRREYEQRVQEYKQRYPEV